jgi:hypothetical protein
MKLAASISRFLQANLHAELCDIEGAISSGTAPPGT